MREKQLLETDDKGECLIYLNNFDLDKALSSDANKGFFIKNIFDYKIITKLVK